MDWRKFYKRRFPKLMMNYWLIWLIFVPLGVFVFGRTFQSTYVDHVFFRFLVDFVGLANAFNSPSYNDTWWFYSLIILYYLLFPLLWRFKTKAIPLLVIAVLVSVLFNYRSINIYLIHFVLGMLLGCNWRGIKSIHIPQYLLVLGLVLSVALRFRSGITWDVPVCLLGAFVFSSRTSTGVVFQGLVYLGKLSMDIFLFHTFIYYYYTPQFIYWSRNPVLIYSSLLLVCVLIAAGITALKKRIRWNY